MYDIERNIEMPPRNGGQGARPKFPFREMDIGDSFFVEGRTARTFSPAIQAAQKRGRGKFSCRAVEGGIRVWRVA